MSFKSLSEQNSRQSRVIRILGEAINNENKKKQLLKQVEKHEIPNKSNEELSNQLKMLLNELQTKQMQQQSDRERELLEKIRIQENEFEKLKNQIEEYQRKAAEFEAEMERNEAEKQEIINNLRNRDSVNSINSPRSKSNQEFSLFANSMQHENEEDLKQKIQEADEEIEKLTKELDELNKQYEEKQEEYRQIQEKFLNQSL